MRRNIVICSDGTGNTFDESVSNVTRLIHLLALDDPQMQIVVYDEGIGTTAKRLKDVDRCRANKAALRSLPSPKVGWSERFLGLIAGYGLKTNVRELYQELSRLYEGPDDKIFLFGFSRGAFTVRALAGLVYRCGLPQKNVTDFDACFDEAWEIYQPHLGDDVRIAAFRKTYVERPDCEIHFLGIWDTVKSYGGLRPISLPHLRHNPIVRTVRHALSLNERRSWFNATTWGQLDSDEFGAKLRLKEEDLSRYKSQDIEEVWFRGCHSDIGGGDQEEQTARISLRWMLAEARAADLKLSSEGESALSVDDCFQNPVVHESLKGLWWLTEYIPRKEIDNSGLYPVTKFVWGRTGQRRPDKLQRNGKITLHTSVRSRPALLEFRSTRSSLRRSMHS